MRKFILIAVVLVTIAAGIFGGVPVYRKWMGRQELDRAKRAFEKKEYKEGLIWLRKVLARNSSSIEAVSIMADLSETMHSPAALYWRERLVELDPGVSSNRFQLARTAVSLGNLASAKKALAGLDAQSKNTGEYHRLSGAIAMSEGDLLSAEQSFLASTKAEPGNPFGMLNLGILQSQRVDPKQALAGRQLLESLRTNATVRNDALRHLALDAMRMSNYTRATVLVGELVSLKPTILNDRLLELEVLKASHQGQMETKLAGLQSEIATNSRAIMEVGRWMLGHGMATKVLKWSGTLHPDIRTNVPVTLVVADAYLATGNWGGLASWIAGQNWEELEYMRQAFDSRAARETGKAGSAKSLWNEAVRATENKLERLAPLQRLVSAWNWGVESEEILWLIVTKYPGERSAMQALAETLSAKGKTRALMDLMTRELRAQPDNPEFQNNVAALALLLDSKEHKPHELARTVYEGSRSNIVFAATYAYSLYKEKKVKEALTVLNSFPPAALDEPSVAGYYGLILKANGDPARGRQYLSKALQGRLLPEEVKLFQE